MQLHEANLNKLLRQTNHVKLLSTSMLTLLLQTNGEMLELCLKRALHAIAALILIARNILCVSYHILKRMYVCSYL